MSNDTVRVNANKLQTICAQILHKVGVREDEATYIATLLVEADLRGKPTHGVMRLATYIDYIKHGSMNVTPNIQLIKDEKATAVIDGDNGLGQIVASHAMDVAVEKAKTYGIGVVSVKNSGHLGEMGLLAKEANRHKMIGYVATNGGPMMAAWGGAKPILGNNPFAVAIPRGDDNPVLIDMALSKTARGNIILADKKGTSIPEGWAIDEAGNTTTDPQAALLGSVLPMGDHKGYALALMIEMLTSTLIGGVPGHALNMLAPPEPSKPLQTTNIVIALNVLHFSEWDSFQARLDDLLQTIKQTGNEGKSVLIPGERSAAMKKENVKLGTPLSKNVYEDLTRLMKQFAIHTSLS